jgi:hypothetical protein
MSWSAAYTLLTVALAYPLVRHLTTTIAGDLVDPPTLASILWWNAHVLPLTERWWNGFAFFPSVATTTFTDHMIGESLIASPLQWLGCNPATAFNITLLATFPLCALSAHWLGFVLTKRHDAAGLCGLAYGFNPYRMPHIAHLQLLAAFGMPAALAALHMALETRRWRWILVFGAAFLVQSLSTAYYVPFFAVLLAMWVLWFIRWNDRWLIVAVATAGAAVVIVMAPFTLEYTRIHHLYGFSRGFDAIAYLGADVTSVLTGPGNSVLWNWTSSLNGGERQTFPGFFVTAVALAGAFTAIRGRRVSKDWGTRTAYALSVVAVLYTAVALSVIVFGPWRFQIGPLVVRNDVFFKPFSVAAAAVVLAIAVCHRARDAWSRRSVLAFYVVATIVIFVCSFGPRVSLLGHQILYRPPYLWLMHLPFFADEIRAPARFTMLAAMTLAATGAVAFDHFPLRGRIRTRLAAALMIAIIADGWIRNFPVASLPDLVPTSHTKGFDAVLEMPLGVRDPHAMYRATAYAKPIVNGNSSYSPPDFAAIDGAIREKDASVIDAIVERGRILVAVDHRIDPDDFWRTTFERHPRAHALGIDGPWSFFTVEPALKMSICDAPTLPIIRARDDKGDVNVPSLSDRNPDTFWGREKQQVGDGIVVDLGQPVVPCAIQVSLGRSAWAFPRVLAIETSVDESAWTRVFSGSPSAEAVRGALMRPTDAWMNFPVPATATRFFRIRIDAWRPQLPWQIAGVVVRGNNPADTQRTPSQERVDQRLRNSD